MSTGNSVPGPASSHARGRGCWGTKWAFVPAVRNILKLLACIPWWGGLSCNDPEPPAANNLVEGNTAEEVEGAPLTLAPVPRIVAGAGRGGSADVLYQVRMPFLLADGRLVVPINGDPSLIIYSRDGQIAKTIGRRGGGPGEFQRIDAAWPVGDTIEVYDPQLQRITRIIPPDSLEVLPLQPQGLVESAVPGRLGNGWVVGGLATPNPDGRNEGVSRDTVVLRRFGRDGEDLGEVARVAGLARYSNAAGRTLPQPLSPGWRARTSQGRLFFGETLRPEIGEVDSNGVVKFALRLRLPVAREPVSDIFQLVQQAAAALPPPPDGRPRSTYTDAPVPTQISAFWDFFIDDLGFIWVLPYDPLRHAHVLGGWRGPGPGGRWTVFTLSGQYVGDVEIPDGLYITQITAEAVVGFQRDDFGVETVVVHDLSRR